jgi:hypothetical protein
VGGVEMDKKYILDILLNIGDADNPCLIFSTFDELVSFIKIWEKYSNQIADYHISHD